MSDGDAKETSENEEKEEKEEGEEGEEVSPPPLVLQSQATPSKQQKTSMDKAKTTPRASTFSESSCCIIKYAGPAFGDSFDSSSPPFIAHQGESNIFVLKFERLEKDNLEMKETIARLLALVMHVLVERET